MEHSWMLDELAHAGAEHLDAGFVTRYDRKQGHPSAAEDVEAFVDNGLGSESVVIDFAAGTGQFTLEAAPAFGRVVAVDVSPAMVAHLERRVAERGLADVEVVRAGFLGYEHDGGPVDGIFTRNALHQIPDFWKGLALERMHTLLRPGGVLRVLDLVYDMDPSEAEQVFGEWFENAADDPERGYTREDLAEHVRTEHSTYRWLFEAILERTGFDIVDVHYRSRVYATYTCRRR